MSGEMIPTRTESREIRRKRTRRRRRKKKTFLWLFRYNQKRGKSRPVALKNPIDTKFIILRYGIFKQSRDIRSEFCPYKGLKHQTTVRPSIKCPCRHRPFCATPLSTVYSSPKFII